MSKCPVDPIWQCPLYIESHTGSGLGCVDDMAEPCLVARGRTTFDRQVSVIVKRMMASDRRADRRGHLCNPAFLAHVQEAGRA